MKNALFVKTTASPITTTRRVIYPLVNIVLYYLETFKSYYRSWIHFASPINTWTVSIQYSSTDSVEKLLQRADKCLITCNDQLTLITEKSEWTESRALQKKTPEEKARKIFFSSFQKTETTQTSSSVFAGRIEKVKKTKFDLDLIKIVDCFLDGHGNYDSNLVSFNIKSLYTNYLLKSYEICINQLVVQMI